MYVCGAFFYPDIECHMPYVLVVITGLIILCINVISFQFLEITPRNNGPPYCVYPFVWIEAVT